ncbi:putative transcription factor C2C2-GATA family [Lupinus albus]|uniref:Putative transcription factor C2C2-GATA family n=1 Tax=Lupinus albus TaxID=3870 RepID=A0A6A4R8H2_LUPAL|nr:putative transcription factor C2C2-GATA family [Lupinus albus]
MSNLFCDLLSLSSKFRFLPMISFSFLDDFFKDLNCDNEDFKDDTSYNYLERPLYVPQDTLHDMKLWDLSSCNDLDPTLLSLLNSDYINEKSKTKAKDNHVSQSNIQNKSSFIKKPRTKKPRRKRPIDVTWYKFGFVNSKTIEEKRCSQCETKHSPVWRVGPMRKSTLCNACGIRYKSRKFERT